MNERIKELIEQAGLSVLLGNNWLYGEQLEKFAKLVLADEPENIPKYIGMKERDGELRIKAGLKLSYADPYCIEGFDEKRGKMFSPFEALQHYADLVRADERAECAKLCLEPIYYGQVQNNRSMVGGNKYVRDKTAQECAAAIRARRNT